MKHSFYSVRKDLILIALFFILYIEFKEKLFTCLQWYFIRFKKSFSLFPDYWSIVAHEHLCVSYPDNQVRNLCKHISVSCPGWSAATGSIGQYFFFAEENCDQSIWSYWHCCKRLLFQIYLTEEQLYKIERFLNFLVLLYVWIFRIRKQGL